MASENPNNNPPPGSTPPPQWDEIFGVCIGPSKAADCNGITNDGNVAGVGHVPIPHTLLPDSSLPIGSMYRTPHSYAHNSLVTGLDSMTDVTQFNSFHNFINARGHMPGFLNSEGNVRGIYESAIRDNTNADDVRNSGNHVNFFRNPHIAQNFIAFRGDVAGGFQMTGQSGETNSSNTHRPQINRNFVACGAGTPVQYHTPDSRAIGINDNIEVSSFQSNCLEKIDGNFLTLGIGDSTEAKSVFRNERAIFPQLNTSHGQKANRSSLNPGQSMASGFSSFQNNVGGFSSLAGNVGGWTLSNNDLGVMSGTDTGLSSSPFNTLQTPQADTQHCIPMPSNRSLVLGGHGDARSANTDPYKGIQGYPTAASRPFSSSQAGLLDHGQVTLPGLTSESAKTTRTITHPSSHQLQKHLMKSVRKFQPESSMISPFLGALGSTTIQDQSGQQFRAYQGSATQATESGHFSERIGAQTARHSFLASEGSAAQVSEGGLFPKRTGVQLASYLGQPQDTGTVQHSRDLLGHAFPTCQVIPVARGNQLTQSSNVLVGSSLRRSAMQPPPSTKVALLSPVPSKDLLRPTLTTGQIMPAVEGNRFARGSNILVGPSFKQSSIQPIPASPLSLLSSLPSKNLPGPSFTTGPVIPVAKGNRLSQASSALVGPSLKRSAIRPLPSKPRVQRRKTMPQPSIHPSVPTPIQFPSFPFPTQTAPALHIKQQGCEGLPQPIGQKCPLCKRDLSYTPEGPLFQPTIPPAVAVLPCSHVFHDHCLQLITPEDQSKHPPCIPCAIGES